MFQSELTATSKRAEKLLGERERIKAAIAKTTLGLAAAEQEAGSALSILASAEADHALLVPDATVDGKVPVIQPADTRASRKALAVARENLETHRTRVAGLEVRLALNRAALQEAQGDLDRARAEAGSQRLNEIKPKIAAAASSLRALLLEALAVDQSVNGNGGSVHRWASSPNLLSEDLTRNLLGTNPGNDGSAPWVQDARLANLAVPAHADIAARIEKELTDSDNLQIVPRAMEQAA